MIEEIVEAEYDLMWLPLLMEYSVGVELPLS